MHVSTRQIDIIVKDAAPFSGWDTIRDMCHNMKHSYAITSQKMRTLNTCIRTEIRYAFSVAAMGGMLRLHHPSCRGNPC